VRVRCKSCGYVRAKNSTRQIEHILTCKEFLNSEEGQRAAANGELVPAPLPAAPGSNEIWRGKAPNPSLTVNRRAPQKTPRHSGNNMGSTPSRAPTGPPRPAPSLATHLLALNAAAVISATQLPFLGHAGCGTLSAPALLQWLNQDSHISRGFVSFIGTLIGKVRLPETANSQQNTTFRTLDLLISTLNNVRREMSFFEATAQKHNLTLGGSEAKPATQALLDLFANACSPSASLLQGLVVLWAVEHVSSYLSTFHLKRH
jgi:hypothetical protein